MQPPKRIDNREKIRKAIYKGAKKGLEDVADAFVREARQRAPVKRGDLARGIIRDPVETTEESVKTAVRSTEPYAAATEYGSATRGEASAPGKKTRKKYPIVPKRRKALRWKEGGKEVFASKVMHPGVRPQPHMRPAGDAIEPEAPSMISKKIAMELKKVTD